MLGGDVAPTVSLHCFFFVLAALHEKIFVVFMVTALLYELITIVLFRWCHKDPLPETVRTSQKLQITVNTHI